MMVGEVISNIENNAHFTFDFLMLLVLAGVIAFLGLVESSSVTLVASMLISPLMGPILAGIFGTVIGDPKLRNLGIWNELMSLGICIIVGFVLGLIVCPWIEAYGATEWPTREMRSRGWLSQQLFKGELRALWVGVLVAVPSGAGVALSVLGGNAGSLVGVAISASLLPPAVNAGFFWALSLLVAATGGTVGMYGPKDPVSENFTTYKGYYSEEQAIEAALLGLASLALTLANILCIVLTGIAILRLKEVTPDKIPQTFSEFWKNDVRQARKGKYSRLDDSEELMEEGRLAGLDGTIMQGLFDEVASDRDVNQLRRFVPELALSLALCWNFPRAFNRNPVSVPPTIAMPRVTPRAASCIAPCFPACPYWNASLWASTLGWTLVVESDFVLPGEFRCRS